MVAVRLVQNQGRVDEIAISIGSCSAVAMRLTALETHLTGRFITDLADEIDETTLADVLSPITDVRGDAAYRITAATELLRRILCDLTPSEAAR